MSTLLSITATLTPVPLVTRHPDCISFCKSSYDSVSISSFSSVSDSIFSVSDSTFSDSTFSGSEVSVVSGTGLSVSLVSA